MSELPDGIEPAPIPEPQDSALGIVVRRSERGWDVLLGRRSRRARFMPGHLVFPGGKLEAEDDPARPGAFRRCASRELFEEAGVLIPPSAWVEAGERTTPPMFPFRFRTRFFVTSLQDGAALPATPPAPEEIEELSLTDAADVLEAWSAGRALVPPPILPILRLMTEGSADGPVMAARIAATNAVEEANPRIEFLPGFWVLPVRTRTLPPASCTNVWMPGGRRFVVIDPGSAAPEDNARLLAVVARRVAEGGKVEAIVLTHHHRDHVSGAASIAAALRVPVLAHVETLSRLAGQAMGVTTRGLGDGDTIDLQGMTLRAVHTPGHAPGHLALFEPARRALIAGDLVSGLSTILVGLAGGDMDAYLASLRRAMALDPTTVLPSHGPPLPGKALAATLTHREAREARIVAALSDGAPHPLSAIAVVAYAGAPDTPAFLREMQTRAHLDRLERHGLVERTEAGYRIPGTSILS